MSIVARKINNFRSFCEKTLHFSKIIEKETEIVTNQLVPELKLHLITPNCRLFHSKMQEDFPFPADPYWAFHWPGGLAISRYIFDNPNLVRNKRILDFGSGCGSISIASKICGAKTAIANDIDKVALIASKMNAILNNVVIDTESKNMINNPSSITNYDLIFLGDVFYDEEFAALILPWIKDLVKNGKLVIIGDPDRHALKNKKLNLKLLNRYELPDNVCIENHGFKFTNLWQLEK